MHDAWCKTIYETTPFSDNIVVLATVLITTLSTKCDQVLDMIQKMPSIVFLDCYAKLISMQVLDVGQHLSEHYVRYHPPSAPAQVLPECASAEAPRWLGSSMTGSERSFDPSEGTMQLVASGVRAMVGKNMQTMALIRV